MQRSFCNHHQTFYKKVLWMMLVLKLNIKYFSPVKEIMLNPEVSGCKIVIFRGAFSLKQERNNLQIWRR